VVKSRRLQIRIEGISVDVERDRRAKVYVTYVPALGNISTFGKTLEEAIEQTRDMILTHIVSLDDDGLPLPFSKPEIKRLRRALRVPILAETARGPRSLERTRSGLSGAVASHCSTAPAPATRW
jgi:predicted RNase H-like HicB family nuclease